MMLTIKYAVATIVLMLSIATSVTAGRAEDGAAPDNDGVAAYNRGDYANALRIYRALADQGAAIAQNNLGVMYELGQGVAQDFAAAAKWYRLAAGQGTALGQLNLGLMYAKGQGVPQDFVLAHMWFNLAAAQANKEAEKNRDIAARQMTIAQITQAQNLARDWKPNSTRGTAGIVQSRWPQEWSGRALDVRIPITPWGH